MAKATNFKCYARLATKSTNLQMTNCPLSGRGQGHVTPSTPYLKKLCKIVFVRTSSNYHKFW